MKTPFSDLDSLSLHEVALEAAKNEKSATLHLLEVLYWIEKRRVYNDRSSSTLFDYVHRKLGYSESQASERIRAMKLAFSFPEVRESLESGRLTLTSVAKFASHVKNEELRPEQVIELLPEIENRSVKQVERILAAAAPETPKTAEKLRPIDATRTELKLILDEEAMKLLEEARMLDANPGVAMLEIFKQALKKYVGEKRVAKTGALKSAKLRSTAVTKRPHFRYVPRAIKRAVWERAKSSCEYTDEQSGTRCSATRALTLEHRLPFALGGPHTLENLALYCANHNSHAAEKVFGPR